MPSAITGRNSRRLASSSVFGSGTGADWTAARRWAIRPVFHSSRSSCQAPSDRQTRATTAVNAAGSSCELDARLMPPATRTGPTRRPPGCLRGWSPRSMRRRRRVAHAPPINAHEQEQPDDVDEMPVPGGGLEAEMVIRLEVALNGAPQAYGEKDRADDNMEA